MPPSPKPAIDETGPVLLGACPQWIYARGSDPRNPVLLYLHGGPGFCESQFAHAYAAGLERSFTVVHWDQRGANRSVPAGFDPATLTRERIVQDAIELIDHLRARFRQDRIILLGHSWGSILGALVAHRRPDLLHAYVGIGQFVEGGANERLSYEFALAEARRQGHAAATRELEELGPPPYPTLQGLFVQRRWLAELGGTFADPRGFLRFLDMIQREDDRYRPVVSLREMGTASLEALWPSVEATDLFREAPEIRVPVLVLQGRRDYCTPAPLAEQWFARLEAPAGKKLVWFENSAHWPHHEETPRFLEVVKRWPPPFGSSPASK